MSFILVIFLVFPSADFLIINANIFFSMIFPGNLLLFLVAYFIEYRSTNCSAVKCGYFFIFYFLESDSHCFCNLWNKSSFQVRHFFEGPCSIFFTIAFGRKLTG
ncbi:hypothetical protein AMTRI_Chr03g46940 [Amborella trichopoda]